MCPYREKCRTTFVIRQHLWCTIRMSRSVCCSAILRCDTLIERHANSAGQHLWSYVKNGLLLHPLPRFWRAYSSLQCHCMPLYKRVCLHPPPTVCVGAMHTPGGDGVWDALICRSLCAKEPLIIGLFCGKRWWDAHCLLCRQVNSCVGILCVSVGEYVFVCMWVMCIHIHIYICEYICMYVHMYMYMYVYIYS